jgi:hypothetical protein
MGRMIFRMSRLWLLALLVLTALIAIGAAGTASAQGGLIRLGEFRVEWYCNARGLGVILVNNNADWACTNPDGSVSFILRQGDFDAICRATYNNAGAFALRDGRRPEPAYNWSCYAYVPATPTPTPPRPPSQATRLGGIQVVAYCAGRGLGAAVVNNGRDWACTHPNGSIAILLGRTDYDSMCRTQYNNLSAFAFPDGTQAIAAYNWSCYAYLPPTPTPRPVARPVRLGPLRADAYCNARGYGWALANNRRDWACTYRSGQVAFVMQQATYDAICRLHYKNPRAYALRDGTNSIPAYNWACFVFQ